MSEFGHTLLGIQLNTAGFGAQVIILSVILIIEVSQWYLEGKLHAITTDLQTNQPSNPIKMELSITTTERAQSPSGPSLESKSSMHSTTSKASTPPIRSDPILRILPISTYIVFICGGVIGMCITHGLGLYKGCKGKAHYGVFYISGKCCLYLVFIYRLYKVYKNSVFEFNTTWIKIGAAVSVSWALCMSILHLWTTNLMVVTVEGHRFCAASNNKYVVGLVPLYDLIFNAICCYAFIKPLLILSKIARNEDVNILYRMVAKYTILTTMAALTTVLTLVVFIGTRMAFVVPMDTIINCICILFFNKAYDKYYQCICCGPQKIADVIIANKDTPKNQMK